MGLTPRLKSTLPFFMLTHMAHMATTEPIQDTMVMLRLLPLPQQSLLLPLPQLLLPPHLLLLPLMLTHLQLMLLESNLPHVLTLSIFPFPVLPVNVVMLMLKQTPLSSMEVTTDTPMPITDSLTDTVTVWEPMLMVVLMVTLVWEITMVTTPDTTLVSILPTTDSATTSRENKFPANYL